MFDADDLDGDEPQSDGGLWHLYFLTLVDPLDPDRDFGLVKVGITKGAVERRIENLQTGNPFRLRYTDSFQSPVARALECWIHRTHHMAHLEWLRLSHAEIPALVAKAQVENVRLCEIADARARWSLTESNGTVRSPSAAEIQVHADARGVLEDFWSTSLQLDVTRLRLAVTAGGVGRIPGITQITRRSSFRKFRPNIALERFPELAARHMAGRVSSSFRWHDLPTRGSSQWAGLRAEIVELTRRKTALDRAMLEDSDVFDEEGKRTDALVELHETFIALFQRKARATIDRDYVRAKAVQQMEACEAVSGVCSYKRRLRSAFVADSFRTAHRAEALECSPTIDPFVQRRVFMSCSY